jgi:hypothetical protein
MLEKREMKDKVFYIKVMLKEPKVVPLDEGLVSFMFM